MELIRRLVEEVFQNKPAKTGVTDEFHVFVPTADRATFVRQHAPLKAKSLPCLLNKTQSWTFHLADRRRKSLMDRDGLHTCTVVRARASGLSRLKPAPGAFTHPELQPPDEKPEDQDRQALNPSLHRWG